MLVKNVWYVCVYMCMYACMCEYVFVYTCKCVCVCVLYSSLCLLLIFSRNVLQDKNTWLAVINMLRTKDKLPAVAFVFSRKRIQDLVELLSSIDLTDKSEKSHIDVFVNSSIARLKGSDQKLGQVSVFLNNFFFNSKALIKYWAK